MNAVEIFTKTLIKSYDEMDEDRFISLKEFICSFEETSFSKIVLALDAFRKLDCLEVNIVQNVEIYIKIKGNGVIIVERCESDEAKLMKMLEEYSSVNILSSFSNISRANIAINSTNINQGVKNGE